MFYYVYVLVHFHFTFNTCDHFITFVILYLSNSVCLICHHEKKANAKLKLGDKGFLLTSNAINL